MNSIPKLSFIMATQNRDDLIGESIKSVLNQTYENWELIVVDDHSDENDQTESIILKFNDKRIRYVKLPNSAGSGVACARNYGNLIAETELVAIHDSDDISMPNRARLIVESYEKEGWDIFYSDFVKLVHETGEIITPNRKVKEFVLEDYLNRKFIIPDSSSAYTRQVVTDFPYNSAISVCLDFDLFTRLAKADKKFYFCPEVTYKYRVHQESMTKGKNYTEIENQIISSRGWDPAKYSTREEVLKSLGI